MVRRHIAKEPTSRLAIWARRCAIFSLIATVLVIVIVRAGLIELDPSLAAVTGALAFAGFAILLAISAMVVIWREGIEGLGASLLAIVIGGGLLAYPAYLGTKLVRNPAISDVTTDMGDPPRFDQVARLRPRGTADYPGAVVAARQHAAYPDIEPLQVSAPAQMAYEAARTVIHKRFPTSVVSERAPQGARRDGQIEAVARTPILGFREDVIVRVRAGSDGARIDVRSASRYGRYDLGSNAARVRSLLEDIDDTAAVLVEERNKKTAAKPAPAKTPPQPAKR
jgi:uncharacterized protein (DUF1499 family)